mgnify:CR=1 FL=1
MVNNIAKRNFMAYVTYNTKYISYKTNEYKLLTPFMRSKERGCQTTRTIPGMYLLRTYSVLSPCRGTSERRMYGASAFRIW